MQLQTPGYSPLLPGSHLKNSKCHAHSQQREKEYMDSSLLACPLQLSPLLDSSEYLPRGKMAQPTTDCSSYVSQQSK